MDSNQFQINEEILRRFNLIAACKVGEGPANCLATKGTYGDDPIKFYCQTCSFTQAAVLLGISRSTIYRLIDEKSRYYEPDLPKPVYVSPRRRVFIILELMQYLMRSKMN